MPLTIQGELHMHDSNQTALGHALQLTEFLNTRSPIRAGVHSNLESLTALALSVPARKLQWTAEKRPWQ